MKYLYTYEELRAQRERERIKLGCFEKYRAELYTRYTGKNPAATVYKGFAVTRPDGERIYYTIHYRTDNRRPYAIYINGSQTQENTYIYRGSCEKTLKRIRDTIKAARPDCIFTDLHGCEIIT